MIVSNFEETCQYTRLQSQMEQLDALDRVLANATPVQLPKPAPISSGPPPRLGGILGWDEHVPSASDSQNQIPTPARKMAKKLAKKERAVAKAAALNMSQSLPSAEV